jgi:hypothetical protein
MHRTLLIECETTHLSVLLHLTDRSKGPLPGDLSHCARTASLRLLARLTEAASRHALTRTRMPRGSESGSADP